MCVRDVDQGGCNVVARAIGSSVSPCTIDDNDDGTYTVVFTSAVEGKTSVVVRLEGAELPALSVTFVEAANGK